MTELKGDPATWFAERRGQQPVAESEPEEEVEEMTTYEGGEEAQVGDTLKEGVEERIDERREEEQEDAEPTEAPVAPEDEPEAAPEPDEPDAPDE